MNAETFLQFSERIKAHEGYRLRLYTDSKGFLTIGYGRCIELNGIRPDEAQLMLENDLRQALEDCRRALAIFDSFSEARQVALAELMFQTGLRKFLGFRKMLAAINAADWESAADEAKDSEWYRHLEGLKSPRAAEIVSMIRRG